MKIGFIGLGTMGSPMAVNLHKAGYSLVVYNRSKDKTKEWEGKTNAEVAKTPAEVVRKSDIVITILSNDAAVEEVYLGEEGILAGGKGSSGKIVIDSSTISPELSRKTAEVLEKAGIRKLDAPVTGSQPQAEQGVLTFIVGGSREVFDQVEKVLLSMGKKAVYMGAHGSGSAAKIANNMMSAVHLAALSESLALIKKAGGDPALFLEVVAAGGARSGMAEMKGTRILEGDFAPQFMTELMSKDLGLAAGMAESLKVPIPVNAAVRQIFQAAANSGHGKEDMSAIFKLYQQWAGL